MNSMDVVNKISGPYSNFFEDDEKYLNFDAVQEMVKSISLSKYQKSSCLNSQNGSYKDTKRKIEDFEDDDESQHSYKNNNQEKINDLHKCITVRKTDSENANNEENLQITVEKLQNKLENQKSLGGYTSKYYDGNKDFISVNNINRPFEYDNDVKDEITRILYLKCLSYDNAKKLIECLFHHKIPLKMKLFIILRLEDECINNKDVIRKAFDKSMIHLFESLLEKYCCTVSVFGRNNVRIEEKLRPPRELCLLKPLTKLFANIACYPHSKFHHNDILFLLINAVTFISANVENIQKKINVICQGRTLAGNIFKLNPQDSSQLLSNVIGLRLDECIYGAYDVILYGNIGRELNKNVNEEIIKIQPIMNCTKPDFTLNNYSEYTNDDRKFITIIRAKAPKYILMYITKDWESHLRSVSDNIQQVMETKTDIYFRNGDVVGFHHDEVEIENSFLKSAPFLRGLIVSQQRGNVLIWAMDIGTWVYARREKLHSLMHTTLCVLKPLVCIGQLKGPVCDIDEEFLMYGLSILRHAAFKNNEISKNIFLPDAGENLLLLAEHHNYTIRHYVLDILLALTKFKEGCMFLHTKGFGEFLAGKLEFWAHISRSSLNQHLRINTEICVMVKILSAILKVNTDSKWCAVKRAKRALNILLIGENKHTEIFECVLHQMEKTETQLERKHGHTSSMDSARITSITDTQQIVPSLPSQGNALEIKNLNKNHLENEIIIPGKQKIKEDSSFVFENVVNVKNNLFTHIVEGKYSNDVRPLEMSEIICGLLNNNTDGSIFFGLSSNSVVTGITMQESDIKSFTKDVEIIVKKFVRPSLSDLNYCIKFIPVLENKNGRLQVKATVYVILIKLYPHKRVVYSLHNGTKYYTRKGTITIEHNTEKKKYVEEKDLADKEDSNTSNNSYTSVSDASNIEATETGTSCHIFGEGNISPSISHKSLRFSSDENYGECPHSSETASGNLISPVFQFIKKLIPNAANE